MLRNRHLSFLSSGWIGASIILNRSKPRKCGCIALVTILKCSCLKRCSLETDRLMERICRTWPRVTSNLFPLSSRSHLNSKLTSLLQLLNSWPTSELLFIRYSTSCCSRYKLIKLLCICVPFLYLRVSCGSCCKASSNSTSSTLIVQTGLLKLKACQNVNTSRAQRSLERGARDWCRYLATWSVVSWCSLEHTSISGYWSSWYSRSVLHCYTVSILMLSVGTQRLALCRPMRGAAV